MVTATITEGDMASLGGLNTDGQVNTYGITVTDTTVDAGALNTLNGKTSLAITAGAITTLTGSATDVKDAYAANTAGDISGLGNEAVTVSGSTSVADANTISTATTGVVTATIPEGAMASLSGRNLSIIHILRRPIS